MEGEKKRAENRQGPNDIRKMRKQNKQQMKKMCKREKKNIALLLRL